MADKRAGAKRKNAPGAGRPAGLAMPCGWGCGKAMRAGDLRAHFRDCPKRAEIPPSSPAAAGGPNPGVRQAARMADVGAVSRP